MRYARAVVTTILGLFVSDWTQTAGILLIVLCGFGVARGLGLNGPWTGAAVAGALAVHLVFTTAAENRRRRG